MDKDKFRENNNYAYQLTMSEECIDKLPVFGKEKFKECKDHLRKMEIIDTNSKEYIEIQAYNKFADLMLELYEGNIVGETDCPVRIIRQNIKDIRDKLIGELTERKEIR